MPKLQPSDESRQEKFDRVMADAAKVLARQDELDLILAANNHCCLCHEKPHKELVILVMIVAAKNGGKESDPDNRIPACGRCAGKIHSLSVGELRAKKAAWLQDVKKARANG